MILDLINTILAGLNLNGKVILFVGIVVIVGCLLGGTCKIPFFEGFTDGASLNDDYDQIDKNKPCMALFHSVNCGHCEAMLPEWIKFKKQVGEKANVYNFEATQNPNVAREFEVSAFPTIYWFPKGIAEGKKNLEDSKYAREHNGSRTADAFLATIST